MSLKLSKFLGQAHRQTWPPRSRRISWRSESTLRKGGSVLRTGLSSTRILIAQYSEKQRCWTFMLHSVEPITKYSSAAALPLSDSGLERQQFFALTDRCANCSKKWFCDLAPTKSNNVFYQICLPPQNVILMKEIGDKAAQGRACGNLGNVHYLLGNFSLAIHYHNERLKIAKEFGDKVRLISK